MRVNDLFEALERTELIVREQGGYGVDRQIAGDDAFVVLAVPAQRLNNARHAIAQLGQVTEDAGGLSGELAEGRNYAQFSVRFTNNYSPRRIDSSSPLWSPPTPSDWNPLRTFSQALGVTGVIFSVLVDIAIWLTVVGGPLVLIGLLLKRIFGRH